MVHVLGVQLPDYQYARFALTAFYGIGHKTAHRLCARLQIHDKCKVRSLTPHQITELAAFLSSPSTSTPIPRFPLATSSYKPPPASTPLAVLKEETKKLSQKAWADPLRHIKIESEARRMVKDNIAHQRMIGSYVGKRHAMGLPVRGQNTQNNARTAKKLNRVDRRG